MGVVGGCADLRPSRAGGLTLFWDHLSPNREWSVKRQGHQICTPATSHLLHARNAIKSMLICAFARHTIVYASAYASICVGFRPAPWPVVRSSSVPTPRNDTAYPSRRRSNSPTVLCHVKPTCDWLGESVSLWAALFTTRWSTVCSPTGITAGLCVGRL